jgi:hypothetical protein
MRVHDTDSDHPVPLANLSHIESRPLSDDQNQDQDLNLPEEARTDILTTPRVPGLLPRSLVRRQFVVDKVASECFAGDDPVFHVEHPPHMLEAAAGRTAGDYEVSDDSEDDDQVGGVNGEEKEQEGDADNVDNYGLMDWQAVVKDRERRAELRLGRRMLQVVVAIP